MVHGEPEFVLAKDLAYAGNGLQRGSVRVGYLDGEPVEQSAVVCVNPAHSRREGRSGGLVPERIAARSFIEFHDVVVWDDLRRQQEGGQEN